MISLSTFSLLTLIWFLSLKVKVPFLTNLLKIAHFLKDDRFMDYQLCIRKVENSLRGQLSFVKHSRWTPEMGHWQSPPSQLKCARSNKVIYYFIQQVNTVLLVPFLKSIEKLINGYDSSWRILRIMPPYILSWQSLLLSLSDLSS